MRLYLDLLCLTFNLIQVNGHGTAIFEHTHGKQTTPYTYVFICNTNRRLNTCKALEFALAFQRIFVLSSKSVVAFHFGIFRTEISLFICRKYDLSIKIGVVNYVSANYYIGEQSMFGK